MQRGNHSKCSVKQVYTAILLVFCVSAGCGALAQEKAYYGGGVGEPNDPYQIWTPEQFVAINAHPEDWDSCFQLMADVNLADTAPELIAPIGNHTVPFSGVFDGNNFAIENFVLHSDTLNDVGIFGVVSTQAMQDLIDPYGLGRHYKLYYETYEFDAEVAVVHVQNLAIVHASVRGKKNVGVLAARCYGSIQRCRVTNASVTNAGTESNYLSGGGSSYSDDGVPIFQHIKGSILSSSSMVGHLFIGNMIDCHVSSVTVEGVGMVAGLVGFAHDSKVTLCSVRGSMSGDKWTGGLLGYAVHTQVEQCGTDVSISGGGDAGGLIGFASASALAKCYSLGQIEGSPLSRNMGGFIGDGGALRIANCYSSFDVNGPFFRAVGGFMGSSSGDVLKFCYSSGGVGHSSPDAIWSPPGSWSGTGSFIGHRTFSVWEDQAAVSCFWDMEASGVDVGVNYVMDYTDIALPHEDIFRATTQEMWTQQTYTDAGWDFETIWTLEEGVGYPVLQWELAGDLDGQ